MLVLSRKTGEKIVLPQLGVTISIVRISGNVTRIGVEAPKEILVLREELNKEEKKKSAC